MERSDTHIVVLRESLGVARKPVIRPSGTPGVLSTLKHVGLYAGVNDEALGASTGFFLGREALYVDAFILFRRNNRSCHAGRRQRSRGR